MEYLSGGGFFRFLIKNITDTGRYLLILGYLVILVDTAGG